MNIIKSIKEDKLLKILIPSICLIVFALVYFFISKSSNVHNSDYLSFSTQYELNGTSVPSGWNVSSYEGHYGCKTEDGVVTLSTEIADDLRLVRKVSLKSNTIYVFSADILTSMVCDGRGANLSIDNYSLDRCCVYSNGLHGSSEWNNICLAFKTGDDQTDVILALRLGGYSEASSGSVSFKNILLFEDNTRLDFQPLVPWGDAYSDSDQDDEDTKIWDSEKYKSMFAVMEWVAVLSTCVMIFCFYRNISHISLYRVKHEKIDFAIIFCTGIILRVVLCFIFGGHDTDMSCFTYWGQNIAENGTAQFYTAVGHEWYDYPPGYMLFLGFWSKIINLIGLNPFSKAGSFFYMMPAIAADWGCALIIAKTAKENNYSSGICIVLTAFVFLNPAVLYLSGAWGQIDSILSLFLLLSFRMLLKDRWIFSGLFFGIAVVIKWQALMFGPMYAVGHILLCLYPVSKRKNVLSRFLKVALSAIFALIVIFVISLPFKGDQNFLWIIPKFLKAASGYDYASVEAYNYQALCGGNWVPSSDRLSFLIITFKQFGIIAIIVSIVLCTGLMAFLFHIAADNNERSGAFYISSALCMSLIFTFGHYMHERYLVPVLFVLPLAFIFSKNRKYLLVCILFTATTFLNEMSAMYVVSKEAMDIVRSTPLHMDLVQICSFAETAVCVYLIFTCFREVSAFFIHTED